MSTINLSSYSESENMSLEEKSDSENESQTPVEIPQIHLNQDLYKHKFIVLKQGQKIPSVIENFDLETKFKNKFVNIPFGFKVPSVIENLNK